MSRRLPVHDQQFDEKTARKVIVAMLRRGRFDEENRNTADIIRMLHYAPADLHSTSLTHEYHDATY